MESAKIAKVPDPDPRGPTYGSTAPDPEHGCKNYSLSRFLKENKCLRK